MKNILVGLMFIGLVAIGCIIGVTAAIDREWPMFAVGMIFVVAGAYLAWFFLEVE